MKQQVRIIGGQWRGRKISVPDVEHLRPTSDRIRETLFNWLMPVIKDAKCADLYAGTGILGIESLSRFAKSCDFAESDRGARKCLEENIAELAPSDAALFNDANRILDGTGCYDVIFLDPPYKARLLSSLIEKIARLEILSTDGLVFVEDNQPLDFPLPEQFEWYRQKKAGQVYFGLVQLK